MSWIRVFWFAVFSSITIGGMFVFFLELIDVLFVFLSLFSDLFLALFSARIHSIVSSGLFLGSSFLLLVFLGADTLFSFSQYGQHRPRILCQPSVNTWNLFLVLSASFCFFFLTSFSKFELNFRVLDAFSLSICRNFGGYFVLALGECGSISCPWFCKFG